jgi:hypothetical protein
LVWGFTVGIVIQESVAHRRAIVVAMNVKSLNTPTIRQNTQK